MKIWRTGKTTAFLAGFTSLSLATGTIWAGQVGLVIALGLAIAMSSGIW